ncbi:MAG: PIN domain-containing protein [Gemmatimonadales bacterium]|nr:PIN domain-containing protein [Gemmatimonadales bacterium]MDZ4390496.1 PIN domain-containing protein [Gemmatimonadales bacterium]PKQ02742.1 MAG: VapC toxin family PIN domain ribonuclease [Alphaproteobacteria bacterium HGW-Alphaproteobacteria-11]
MIVLDTTILASAEGLDGSGRREETLALLSLLPRDAILLPAQSLAEFAHLLHRKAKYDRARVGDVVTSWREIGLALPTSGEVIDGALHLMINHQFQTFDAIILAAAIEARAAVMLSEDMQHGFTSGGVTIVNPFVTPMHPALKRLVINR